MSINRLIPNILTVLALSAGLSSLRFALNERWDLAVIAIFAAAVLDSLDGRIARLIQGTSKFGAELDSLSDFVCFGVAPALILYLWRIQDLGRWGWVLVLLFVVCCALRLARFNTDVERPERPPWAFNYFVGVPSPAGAGLVLLPVILTQQFGPGIFDRVGLVALFMVVVAGLLVSTIPTFSFKRLKVPHPWVLPTMLLVGMVTAFLLSEPFATLSALLVAYAISIPLAVNSYARLKRRAEALQRGEADPEGTPGADTD